MMKGVHVYFGTPGSDQVRLNEPHRALTSYTAPIRSTSEWQPHNHGKGLCMLPAGEPCSLLHSAVCWQTGSLGGKKSPDL